jgi:glycosyltransferase involved in cell wall biosynthesis
MTGDRINLMLWYWGRRGFPVRLADNLARYLGGRNDVTLSTSLSLQSEGFSGNAATGVAGYHVDTFQGLASAPAALLRLPKRRRELAEFANLVGVEVVFALMRHPFGPFIFPALRRQGQRILLAVHDALPHPGDSLPFWRQHFRFELAATDGIVVMSDTVAELMATVYRSPAERTFFMPLPAPDFAYQVPRKAPIGRPWRLTFFGRIRDYKGLDLLAEAFAHLHSRFNVTLRIVGEGQVAALDALASLPGVTVQQGWVPEANIATVFESTDVIVLPYREASQSGILVSALAHGVPIVATPVGGLREQVISGQTGLLAPAATGSALAEALASLLSDPELYAHCSAGALSAAAGTYHMRRAAEAALAAARAVRRLPPR